MFVIVAVVDEVAVVVFAIATAVIIAVSYFIYR